MQNMFIYHGKNYGVNWITTKISGFPYVPAENLVVKKMEITNFREKDLFFQAFRLAVLNV